MIEQESYRRIRELVLAAYGSLERPDFGFFERAVHSRPYEPLVKRLRDYAALEDLAAGEEDVCFAFFIKGRESLWKLDLSAVGPFGIFVRLKNKVGREDFMHYARPDVVGFERKVLEILKNCGIRLLTAEELSEPLPMTLFNTPRDQVRLYQALFSDRAQLPWDTAAN